MAGRLSKHLSEVVGTETGSAGHILQRYFCVNAPLHQMLHARKAVRASRRGDTAEASAQDFPAVEQLSKRELVRWSPFHAARQQCVDATRARQYFKKAIEYAPPSIRFFSRVRGFGEGNANSVAIEVEDQGQPIPDDLKEQISSGSSGSVHRDRVRQVALVVASLCKARS